MTTTAMLSIATEAEATRAAAGLMEAALTVGSTRSEIVEEAPPQPYTTVTLLEDATTRLLWDAAKVMALAQALFEGIELNGAHTGLITYHRTDSVHVAPEAVTEARALIARLYGLAALPARPTNDERRTTNADAGNPAGNQGQGWLAGLIARLRRSKNGNATPNPKSQEAHEAIRPTLVSRLPDTLRPHLDDDRLALYRLVWERFVGSQMRAARYRVITVDLEGDIEP